MRHLVEREAKLNREIEKYELPEQLLTFGRHRTETVWRLWFIDNIVPLRPDQEEGIIVNYNQVSDIFRTGLM